MRAMRLYQPGGVEQAPLQMEDVPQPVAGEGELLVQVLACGVCRTDLHIVEGELIPSRWPVIPGHQIVGRVQALGNAVDGFGVGDRVGIAWLYHTCGVCKYCARGDENLCPSARFTGFDVDGGYAEYAVVGAEFAYRVPPKLTDLQAAPLLCAGIIGYRALRLSGVMPGGNLGLFGFGASAHITIQVAVARGMKVYVFSRSEAHRDLARELGAVWCGSPDQPPERKLDGTIVFAPAGEIVPYAMQHLDYGGTCVLAGIYMSAIPKLDYDRHLYHERRLRSVTASTRRDGIEFLHIAAEIPVVTNVMTFLLAEANEALQGLKSGRIDGAAVLAVAEA